MLAGAGLVVSDRHPQWKRTRTDLFACPRPSLANGIQPWPSDALASRG